MRRRALRLALFTFLLPAPIAFFACGDDDGGGVHGPSFNDGGKDGSTVDGAADTDGAVDTDGGDEGGSDGMPTDSPPSCTTGAVGVIVGTGSGRVAAFARGDAPLVASTLVGGAIGHAPAIAAFGPGFVAVMADGALSSTTYNGVSWSTPTAVGSIGSADAPALAAVGGTLHLAYMGPTGDASVQHKYFHGTYATSWDGANDPVLSGAAQDYAPRPPSAATIGSELLLVEAGDDGNLYAHSWISSWQAAVPIGAPVVKDIIPRVVALDGAGTADAMVVYVARQTSGTQDYKMWSVIRGATTAGVWGTPVAINVGAYTTEGLSAVALSGGRVLVAWRGVDDAKPYYSMYSAGNWSAPAPFFGSSQPTLSSTPALARGICGADAIAALADTSAGARVTRLVGGTWSTPATIAGTSGASDVGIATQP